MQVLPPGSTGGPSRLFILQPRGHHSADGGDLLADYRLSLPACRRLPGGRLPHSLFRLLRHRGQAWIKHDLRRHCAA
ncbi:hypothetical protein KCP73_22350 [Salmonella enterica subsp. enterica]|nr:hypothetical protein KCP73_22350 [Salmonella enterica subsp. enterica]